MLFEYILQQQVVAFQPRADFAVHAGKGYATPEGNANVRGGHPAV